MSDMLTHSPTLKWWATKLKQHLPPDMGVMLDFALTKALEEGFHNAIKTNGPVLDRAGLPGTGTESDRRAGPHQLRVVETESRPGEPQPAVTD